MYARDDVLRSLRYYLTMALGSPPWRVRLERVPVPDDKRPAAAISAGPTATPHARAALDQGPTETRMPVTVTCYPTLDRERLASRAAERLAQQLDDLVTRGLKLDDLTTRENGRPAAGPFRIPLWDWEEVPVEGTAEERTPADPPHDVIWVDPGHGVTAVQDPEDPKRWTVILECRLSWERPGRIPAEEGPLVGSISGEWDEDVP